MTTKEREESQSLQNKKRESQDIFQTEVVLVLHEDQPQNTPDQPTAPNNKELEEEKEKLEDMVQGFMGDQSGLFSSVSRTLIFGIIGTIWVITYSEAGVNIPNNCLLISLVMSLGYLLVDVCHYFRDTMSYQKESKKIMGYNTSDELKTKLREGLTKINRRSVTCIIIKFVLLIPTAIIFGIGLFLLITSYQHMPQ